MRHLVKKDKRLLNIYENKEDFENRNYLKQNQFECNLTSIESNIRINPQMTQLSKELDQLMQDLNDIEMMSFDTKSQNSQRIDSIVNDLKCFTNNLTQNACNLKSSEDKRHLTSLDNNPIPKTMISSHNLLNQSITSQSKSKSLFNCSFNSSQNSKDLNESQNSLINFTDNTQHDLNKDINDNSFGSNKGTKNRNLSQSRNDYKSKFIPKRQSRRQMIRNMNAEEVEELSKYVTVDDLELKTDITVTKLKSDCYEKKRVKLLRIVNKINFHLSKGCTDVWIGFLKLKKDCPVSGLIKMEGDSQRRTGSYGAFTAGCVHKLTVIAGVVRITIESIVRSVETDEQIIIPTRTHYHIRNFKSEEAYIYFEVGLH
jgi:hypothetical protein